MGFSIGRFLGSAAGAIGSIFGPLGGALGAGIGAGFRDDPQPPRAAAALGRATQPGPITATFIGGFPGGFGGAPSIGPTQASLAFLCFLKDNLSFQVLQLAFFH